MARIFMIGKEKNIKVKPFIPKNQPNYDFGSIIVGQIPIDKKWHKVLIWIKRDDDMTYYIDYKR